MIYGRLERERAGIKRHNGGPVWGPDRDMRPYRDPNLSSELIERELHASGGKS